MSQVSPPLRIALIAVLVVGAVWMTVLRPKTAPDAPATAPGVTGLTTATTKAQSAAAAANAATARSQGQTAATTGATTAAPATATAAPSTATATAKPAVAPKKAAIAGLAAGDPSAPYVRALADGKVVVLAFANRRSVDDRAVRGAMHAVTTRGGKVVKRVLDVRTVGRYDAITRGVQVAESPTTLVIGTDHQARVVTGLTTAAELQQLVDDTVAAGKKRTR